MSLNVFAFIFNVNRKNDLGLTKISQKVAQFLLQCTKLFRAVK